MTFQIRRGTDKKLLLCLESTNGLPAVYLTRQKLGNEGLRCAPVETAPTAAGDRVVAFIASGAVGKQMARQLGAKLPPLKPNAYRIDCVEQRGQRTLLVAGGDLFGMLAGLSDAFLRSELSARALTYRGEARTETPAFPLRYYWTWDHSTNWVLDDEGTQVYGAANQYLKKPETYVEDYRRLVDNCIDMRFNGIVIWGFLRDAHGGEANAYEVARYARDRGVAIMPGVGTTGYGGVYYEGDHPYNLENYLAAHPERGNMGKDGRRSQRELTPYEPANRQWIAECLEWLYRSFPIGGVNLENMDLMVDYSAAGRRGRARIRSQEADYFKDQFFAYRSALDVAQRVAPDQWNTYATYSGFGTGRDISNAGADMGRKPYFSTHMPATAIAQWTLTGMLSERPVPLREWLNSGRPKQLYQNPRWPVGLRPPTPRSCGFLHQASQSSSERRCTQAISHFAEACLRGAEAGLEGISVHGEVTARTLAWKLNYLAMRHWTYHPASSLLEFAAAELVPRLGGRKDAHDFIEALCLLEEGKAEEAYKLAEPYWRRAWPHNYPLRGNFPVWRVWCGMVEWASLRVQTNNLPGFSDII